MKRRKVARGFSVIEMMVAVAIVAIVSAIGISISVQVSRQSELVNQLRMVKSNFVIARAKALDNMTPVKFSIDYDTNRLLAVRDTDRTFGFGNTAVVVGDDVDTGMESPYSNVEPFIFDGSGEPALAHWTGLASAGDITDFPGNELVITPNMRVLSGNPLEARSGTFFFRTRQSEPSLGAVHITSLGEVKMAIKEAGTDEWTWTE